METTAELRNALKEILTESYDGGEGKLLLIWHQESYHTIPAVDLPYWQPAQVVFTIRNLQESYGDGATTDDECLDFIIDELILPGWGEIQMHLQKAGW